MRHQERHYEDVQRLVKAQDEHYFYIQEVRILMSDRAKVPQIFGVCGIKPVKTDWSSWIFRMYYQYFCKLAS